MGILLSLKKYRKNYSNTSQIEMIVFLRIFIIIGFTNKQFNFQWPFKYFKNHKKNVSIEQRN